MRYSRNPVDNKEEIVQVLKQLLANTYLLYIQTQGAHWNVIGNDFPQLHTLFQTQYEELTAATDLLAEHIRTYGAISPASAGEFLKLTTLEETQFTNLAHGREVDSHYLLGVLMENHQATIRVATHLGEITGKALHTQNLAADRIAAHEKAVWMLTSTLNKATSRRNPVSGDALAFCSCGEFLDRDCQGNLRCPDCDGPCPSCADARYGR